MKISGIKKAVGEYNRIPKGYYAGTYGTIFINTDTGEIWCKEMEKDWWTEYHDPAIKSISALLREMDEPVSMQTVRAAAEKLLKEA